MMRAFGEWLSQLLNLLHRGDPDESFSARAHRQGTRWEARIDRVLGAGHCAEVYRNTRARQLRRYGVKP